MVTLEAQCLEEKQSNNKGNNENSEASYSLLNLLSTSTILAVPHGSAVTQTGTRFKRWETEAQMP